MLTWTGDTKVSDLRMQDIHRVSSSSKLDDASFIPRPLSRAARSESWLNRLPTLPTLPRLNVPRVRSSQTPSRSDSDEQLDLLNKAVERFCFALTGSDLCNIKHSDQFYWYCTYLEHRAASAWALCATVLVGVTAQTAADDTEARCALYASFAILAECLESDADIAFSPMIEKLQASGLMYGHAPADNLIAFVFQAVGWISALWDPLPNPDLPRLSLRIPQIQGRRQRKVARRSRSLTVSEATHQTVRRIANRFGGPIPVPPFSPEEYSIVSRDVESASITTAYLSFYSLVDLVRVKLVWTDTLSDHLNYDSRTKSLFVFKHPSICLLLMRSDGDTVLSRMFEAELKEKPESVHYRRPSSVGYEEYLLEVILSYQLIFAADKASRRLIAQVLSSAAPLSEQAGTIDPLLRLLCTGAPKSAELTQLYEELELERYENEIAISDIPFLAKKLLHLESFSKRHTPNTLRRLWRDRRNPTTWFALWAVLIIGFGTLIVQLFQLVFQIYQVPSG